MEISSNDVEQYEYVLLYVDNILFIGDDPPEVLQKIDNYFGLNSGSISDLIIYLGENLKPMKMENGVVAWSLIPSQYIREALNSTEWYFKENIGDWCNIPKTAMNTFPCEYEPPLDVSPELDLVLSFYYQSHIGILRWMVELGWIDINTEVKMLELHLLLPREGYL